jgi:hypothetical protein
MRSSRASAPRVFARQTQINSSPRPGLHRGDNQAGAHALRNSLICRDEWIPACAGTTKKMKKSAFPQAGKAGTNQTEVTKVTKVTEVTEQPSLCHFRQVSHLAQARAISERRLSSLDL